MQAQLVANGRVTTSVYFYCPYWVLMRSGEKKIYIYISREKIVDFSIIIFMHTALRHCPQNNNYARFLCRTAIFRINNIVEISCAFIMLKRAHNHNRNKLLIASMLGFLVTCVHA